MQQASRDTATVPGFQQALRNQRATLLQFAQLWPDEIRIEKRGTQNIMQAAPRAQEAVRPQEPNVVTAARPREPNLRLKPARAARQEVTLDRWRVGRPQEPDAVTAVRPREPFLRLKPARVARQETTLDRWRAN